MNALYTRLSKEDGRGDESNSITNQKAMLERYAKDHGFLPYVIFADDDYTGLNTDRPAFQEMLARCESGEIKTVIVKDMSRFGRNYLEVGYITELTFPRLRVRLISVLDGEDSAKGMNDFAPFRNILNEFYSRDISKKVKAGLRAKAMSGKPIARYVYGYRKENGYWMPDETAAPIVREIFTRYVGGEMYQSICTALTARGVDPPTKHFLTIGTPRGHKISNVWATSTIANILDNPVYIGTTVSLKYEFMSYKNRVQRKTEKPIITENTHQPLIDNSTWEAAQRLRGSRRKMTSHRDMSVLSGIIYCRDCGCRMTIIESNRGTTHEQRYFICSKYRKKGNVTCSRHSVRVEVLEAAVLAEIRKITSNVDLDGLIQTAKKSTATIPCEAVKNEKRRSEIDVIIRKLYEDYALGRLPAERFDIMLAEYEKELKTLKPPPEKPESDPNDFVKLVKRYAEPTELTAEMARTLIEKIYINEDKNVRVVWAFVGEL